MRSLLPLLAILSACARSSMDARIPTTAFAAVPGMTRTVGSFQTSEGGTLFEQCWIPDKPPKAVVLIVHGIKDHSSRYNGMAEFLVSNSDVAVCGFDHRGHGRSEGPRFAIHSFSAVLGDIHKYDKALRIRFPKTPIFLFGHSMGGLLVSLYVMKYSPTVSGVILSAPAFHPKGHPFEIAALRVVAKFFPNAPLLNTPNENFSSDKTVVAAMSSDPFIDQGSGTGKMALELVGGIAHAWKNIASFREALLILHGSADRVVDTHGSVELQRHVPNSTLRIFAGAQHDLSHDPMRAQVLDALREWIEHRMAESD